MTECSTCWGTGRYKGWGAPCADGCPIPTKKQGLSSVTNSDDLDTDAFYGVGASAPEEIYKRAKAASDLEDQFIAPKIFPKGTPASPAGNPFSPPPKPTITSSGDWRFGYLYITWREEEITFSHKLHSDVELLTMSRKQGAVPGVSYTPPSNHLASQFLIQPDPKALAQTIMSKVIRSHFKVTIRNRCSLYETSVIRTLTEIFTHYFNPGTKP